MAKVFKTVQVQLDEARAGLEKWTIRTACSTCGSHVEYDVKDLVDQNDMRTLEQGVPGQKIAVFVKCPVCDTRESLHWSTHEQAIMMLVFSVGRVAHLRALAEKYPEKS